MKTPLILLAEDSDDDAFFFERVFEKADLSCSLHHVVNGVEAVEFLQKASRTGELPQTMFLDLKMPILNGFDVLEWMSKQTFAVPIQVIVLSGSDHEGDKARAAQLGAADYLVKPIRVGDLHRILQHVCPPQMGVAG
jgi:CheY-like chemotaxis protein